MRIGVRDEVRIKVKDYNRVRFIKEDISFRLVEEKSLNFKFREEKG